MKSYCDTCKVEHDWSGFTHADWSDFCACGCRCPDGEPKVKEAPKKECKGSPFAHCRCDNRSYGPIVQHSGPNYNNGEWYPH
jgi:hypothetical protein